MESAETVTDKVAGLVEKLKSLRQELINVTQFDDGMQLGQPTSEEDICIAEQRNDFKFPPSYRAFLKLHNGWHLFWPDWCILGVSGKLNDKMLADAKKTMAIYSKIIEHKAALDKEPIEERVSLLKKEELVDPEVVYPSHHIVLCTDFNSGIMVFDRNRCRADGECEIIALRYAEIQCRCKDFFDLFYSAIKDTREELKKEKQRRKIKKRKRKPTTNE